MVLPKCPYGKKWSIPQGCRKCSSFDPEQGACMKCSSYKAKAHKIEPEGGGIGA